MWQENKTKKFKQRQQKLEETEPRQTESDEGQDG